MVDKLFVRRGAVLGQYKSLGSLEPHAGVYIRTSCLSSELVHCAREKHQGLYFLSMKLWLTALRVFS